MSQIIEDMRKQERTEANEAIALKLLKRGKDSLSEISEMTDVPFDRILELQLSLR